MPKTDSLVAGLAVVFDNDVSVDKAHDLCRNQIEIKKYYKPLAGEVDCVDAHDLYDRILIYPCHTGMSKTDVDLIVQNIKDILTK